MSAELPIDVHYEKSVEWLLQRRLIPSAYQKNLRVVQAKVETALADRSSLPSLPELAELLPPSRRAEDITYFDCRKVLEALKAAGLGEKNFIGTFTHPVTAGWADIVKRFESGTLYLAHAATFLVQQSLYEMPALKAEMGRAEKELAELNRKHNEYVRMAQAARDRFVSECGRRRLGECDRDELASRLRASCAELPPLYVRVAALCQDDAILAGRDYYHAFVRFSLTEASKTSAPPSTSAKPKGKGKGAPKEAAETPHAVVDPDTAVANCLPLLAKVQDLSLEAADGGGGAAEGKGEGSPAVDWGDDEAETGGGAAIEVDWGGDEAATGGEAIEVDWGGDKAATGGDAIEVDWGGDAASGAAGEVNWGDDEALVEVGESWGAIEVEGGGEGAEDEERTAAGFLASAERRNALLDELHELSGFLSQRLEEISTSSSDGLPVALQLDTAHVEGCSAAVRQTFDLIDNEHTRHLIMLSTDERYFERQQQSLCQMLNQSDKMRGLADDLQTRHAELTMMLKTAFPKYQAASARVKQVKGEFEQALGAAHFKGRAVNVMGLG